MDFESESVVDGMAYRKPGESMSYGDVRRCLPGMPQAPAEQQREFEEIEWHVDGQPDATTGVLVGQTRRGMTMVTEHQSGCCEGNVLIPSSRFQWRGWRRPVQIKRIVQLSDAIDLIAADYITPQTAG